MDEKVVTAIHELANALAGLGNWQQQLVSMAILLVVAAGGSFFGAYLKTRATNAAMSDDLDAIKTQLAATTHTTKSIEAQISKRGELHSLRIKKLEALMEAFIVADDVYRSNFHKLLSANLTSTGLNDNIEHVMMLAKFYFPELKKPLEGFRDSWLDCLTETLEERKKYVGSASGDQAELRLTLWRELGFPSKDIPEQKSADAERLLVDEMHALLAEGDPQNEAGRAPE
ncbi:hypothetical protein [Achromobacter spanius]